MRLSFSFVAFALLAPFALGLAAAPFADAAPAPTVRVRSSLPSTIRVRVSKDGDCDAAPNNLSYDGEIHPGETLHIPLTWWCVCASNTSLNHPDWDWGPWARYCGPPRTSKRDTMTPKSFSIYLDPTRPEG